MDDEQFDTLLRDVLVVAPPDPELVRQERVWFHAEAGEPTATAVTALRSRRRWPIVVGGGLGLVGLGGVGAAAAGGLFDPSTERMVNSVDCGLTTDNAELITSETDSDGQQVEFWVLDSDEGSGTMLIDKSSTGEPLGGELGCGRGARGAQPFYAGTWASFGMNGTDEEAVIRLIGRMPIDASAAVVTFTNGTKVTVTPDKNGYFLQLFTVFSDWANVGVTSVEPVS